MQYLEVGLELKHDLGQDYWVSVDAPEGQAYLTIRLPVDISALKTPYRMLPEALLLEELRQGVSSSLGQTVQAIGQRLFDALMVGQIRALYKLTREKAEELNMGVRLRLWFLTPELAALPWEYLYNAEKQEFLSLSATTAVVRSALFSRSRQRPSVSLPLRILMMYTHLADTELEVEKAHIGHTIAPIEKDRLIEGVWFGRPEWKNVERAQRKGPWHIFYLTGHTQHLPLISDMGRLLAEHTSLQVVLLNLDEQCNAIAFQLAQWGIPAVLSLPKEIDMEAQTEGIQALYQAFAEGRSAEEAVTSMRQAIRTIVPETLDWGKPVFYMQAADGNLFDIVGQPL